MPPKRSFSQSDDGSAWWQFFSKRVHNKPVEDLKFIEIFSGTGGLTAAVRKCGLIGSTGVDATVKKGVKAPTLKLDLTTLHGKELLFDVLKRPEVVGCHIAPPCGTASRAREIRKHVPGMPQPLRTATYPDGLPSLEGKDKLRCEQANILYDLTAEICKFCHNNFLLFSVENPASSLFWATSMWKNSMSATPGLMETLSHHCMFGGTRKKHTRFAHNILELQHLR